MNPVKIFVSVIALSLMMSLVKAQNISINILTQNSGIVKKGEAVFLEVTINNTSATDTVLEYKLKPQISFPSSAIKIPKEGHVLPPGWNIIFNTGGVVRLTNGTDIIAPYDARTILLKIEGSAVAESSAISANLLFSNGKAPGSISGTAPVGDVTADNISTSTIAVEN